MVPALEAIRFSDISSLDRTTTETLNLGSAEQIRLADQAKHFMVHTGTPNESWKPID